MRNEAMDVKLRLHRAGNTVNEAGHHAENRIP